MCGHLYFLQEDSRFDFGLNSRREQNALANRELGERVPFIVLEGLHLGSMTSLMISQLAKNVNTFQNVCGSRGASWRV
jgi:hypothetical protein